MDASAVCFSNVLSVSSFSFKMISLMSTWNSSVVVITAAVSKCRKFFLDGLYFGIYQFPVFPVFLFGIDTVKVCFFCTLFPDGKFIKQLFILCSIVTRRFFDLFHCVGNVAVAVVRQTPAENLAKPPLFLVRLHLRFRGGCLWRTSNSKSKDRHGVISC